MAANTLLALILLLIPSVASAKLGPCAEEGAPPNAECGRIKVPEDRTLPDGRALELFVLSDPTGLSRGTGPARNGPAETYRRTSPRRSGRTSRS
jgi:hypothetical protein